MKAKHKHLHLWTKVFGRVTIAGRRYTRFSACIVRGCKARKP